MSDKVCVFCGQKAGSREHVIPAWLTKNDRYKDIIKPAIYTSSLEHLVVAHDFQKVVSERGSMPNGNVTCKYVCARCNGGWMSKIEHDMKELADLSGWGNTPVDLSTHRKLIHRWLMLRFTAINAYWGNEARYNKTFCKKIMDDCLEIHYSDYFIGKSDAVRLSIASPIPEPGMDSEDRLTLCGNSVVVSAQIGRMFFRAFHTGILSGIGVVRENPDAKVLSSKFPHRFSPSTHGIIRGDEREFIGFSSRLLICQLVKERNSMWEIPTAAAISTTA